MTDEPEMGFDPIRGWGRYGDPLIQSTLLKRDHSLNLVNDLAQNVQLSEDRLVWQVTLRKDAYFSDGTNLTAHDVVFTYQQIQRDLSMHDLAGLSSVVADDEYQVSFTLHEPDLGFQDHFVSVGIVPQHAYSKEYAQSPLGSGPFMLQRWDKGQQVILTLNPHYHGEQPELDSLVIVFAGEDSLTSLVRSRQLHLAALPHRYVDLLPDNYHLVQVATNDNRGIVWPMNQPSDNAPGNTVTADPVIRQVIDQAIDRQLLVDGILRGYGREAFSLADGLPWGPTPKVREQEEQDALKMQLDTAGWIVNPRSGLRHKHGVDARIYLVYLAGDSVREQLSLAVAAMLQPLGIEIIVEGASWSQIAQRMHNDPVMMGFGSHGLAELYNVYMGTNAGQGWYNSGYYQNAAVDTVLTTAKRAANYHDAAPYFQQLHQQLQQDLPWTWLVNIDHLYAVNTCLDIGQPIPEPHQHGWPITSNIAQWKWLCD
ncbi:ABC transporter substrate-binding protein [Thaumasiovibrio sp. DFM-14]|uniref:ABC transporter substrate-binding protein n=1 Tax=Thaumasiovibrio sp. DFM-14 TaxID=3384792 RepID=UPI0039A2D14B